MFFTKNNMYSQNGEDKLILERFGELKGSILDIGANDGTTFSNSRLLIENGWIGTLLEPSLTAFSKLQELYKNDKYTIAYNCGIANETGTQEFWDSESHLPSGNDIALLSSVPSRLTERWKNSVAFNPTKAFFYTFEDFELFYLGENERFEVISIDAEGYDYDILKQIDLAKYNTKMLCIEWNGDTNLLNLYTEYCNQFDLKELHRNEENLIFAL
jgi:FkbM family methyltransferase